MGRWGRDVHQGMVNGPKWCGVVRLGGAVVVHWWMLCVWVAGQGWASGKYGTQLNLVEVVRPRRDHTDTLRRFPKSQQPCPEEILKPILYLFLWVITRKSPAKRK